MDSRKDSSTDSAALFRQAVSIMESLRGPGGCPWDREQTFDTIKKYTLEETYEVFDAIERRHWADLCDELGDLLLQVLFYSQLASESNYFSISDVVYGLNQKLIRRHPHVFGSSQNGDRLPDLELGKEGAAIDSATVVRNWEEIKKSEKADRSPQSSLLDAVPRALPALLEARKLGSKASKVGFDWSGTDGVFAKLEEECSEVKEAIESAKVEAPPEDSVDLESEVASEIGDLLFTVVNLARHLKVDPEMALRQTNAKFRLRFRQMESAALAPLETLTASELESLWSLAKASEPSKSEPPA
jgi:MazG family protein